MDFLSFHKGLSSLFGESNLKRRTFSVLLCKPHIWENSGSNCCHPVRLQDSFITSISESNVSIYLICCIQIWVKER